MPTQKKIIKQQWPDFALQLLWSDKIGCHQKIYVTQKSLSVQKTHKKTKLLWLKQEHAITKQAQTIEVMERAHPSIKIKLTIQKGNRRSIWHINVQVSVMKNNSLKTDTGVFQVSLQKTAQFSRRKVKSQSASKFKLDYWNSIKTRETDIWRHTKNVWCKPTRHETSLWQKI